MNPSKNKFGSLVALMALMLGVPGFAKYARAQEPTAQSTKQAAPVKCVDAPVTSTLQLTGDVTQSTNYLIEGDGLGSYFNGVDSVSSIIQAANCTGGVAGDWILDTLSSPTRTFLIDLRQPVPASNAQPIFTYQYVPSRVIVKCGGYANSGGFPAMSLNQTLSCAAFVSFQWGGTKYRLSMTSGANVQTDYSETNNAQVSCTALSFSSNQCAAWTVFPITQPGGSVQNVARLEKFGNGGKITNLGDFYTTFLFNVTNP
jgi:hypothetical protein